MRDSTGAGRFSFRPAPSPSVRVAGLSGPAHLSSEAQRATAIGIGAAFVAAYDRQHPVPAYRNSDEAWIRAQVAKREAWLCDVADALGIPLEEAQRRWGGRVAAERA
jgi:hypothetical protein